jgi:ribosomal protein L37AE/L43A
MDLQCELPVCRGEGARSQGVSKSSAETKISRMEHICVGCGYTEVNNNATSPSTCKKCGEQMLHSWDKPLDHKREMMPEEDDD